MAEEYTDTTTWRHAEPPARPIADAIPLRYQVRNLVRNLLRTVRGRLWTIACVTEVLALIGLYAYWFTQMPGAQVTPNVYILPGSQAEVTAYHHSAVATMIAYFGGTGAILLAALAGLRRPRRFAGQAVLLVIITIAMFPYLHWAYHVLNPLSPPPAPGPGYKPCFTGSDDCAGG